MLRHGGTEDTEKKPTRPTALWSAPIGFDRKAIERVGGRALPSPKPLRLRAGTRRSLLLRDLRVSVVSLFDRQRGGICDGPASGRALEGRNASLGSKLRRQGAGSSTTTSSAMQAGRSEPSSATVASEVMRTPLGVSSTSDSRICALMRPPLGTGWVKRTLLQP